MYFLVDFSEEGGVLTKGVSEVKKVVGSLSGFLAKLEWEVEEFSKSNDFLEDYKVEKMDSYRRQLNVLSGHVSCLEIFLNFELSKEFLCLEEQLKEFIDDLKFVKQWSDY